MDNSGQNNVYQELIERYGVPEYFRTLGIEVKELGKGYSRLSMGYDKKLLQSFGMVHGGAIFSLADSAGALAVITLLKEPSQFSTLEMKINYLEPVYEGVTEAKAYVDREGRHFTVSIEVINKHRLVAKCLGTYIIVGQK